MRRGVEAKKASFDENDKQRPEKPLRPSRQDETDAHEQQPKPSERRTKFAALSAQVLQEEMGI